MLGNRLLLPALRNEIDRLFEPWINFETSPRPFPALNLWEDGETLYAEAELPGMRLEDLEILVRGNELTVKGARKPLEDAVATFHRQERATGEFVRYIELPAEVDAEHVEATLRDGVLTLKLPKAERAKARRIQVRAV